MVPRGVPDLSDLLDVEARLTALDAGTVLPVVLLLFRSPEINEARRRRALPAFFLGALRP